MEYIVNCYYKGVYILDELNVPKTEELIQKAAQWASETSFDPFGYGFLPSIQEIEEVELVNAWKDDLGDLSILVDRCRAIIKLDKVKNYHNYVDYSLTYGRYNLSTIDKVVNDPNFLEEEIKLNIYKW